MPTKELVIICADGIKGVLDVQETDTLADVRKQIEDELDDDLIVPDYGFHVGEIRISVKQERKKRAWDVLEKVISMQPKRPRSLDAICKQEDQDPPTPGPAKRLKPTIGTLSASVTPQPTLATPAAKENVGANNDEQGKSAESADSPILNPSQRLSDAFDKVSCDQNVPMQGQDDSDDDTVDLLVEDLEDDFKMPTRENEVPKADELKAQDNPNKEADEAIAASRLVLNSVKTILDANPLFCSQDRREEWSKEVTEILSKSAPKTIVGVLGNTGVGKVRHLYI